MKTKRGRVVHTTVKIMIECQGRETEHDAPFAYYECPCGHEDARPCPPYAFPACEACGAVVMPEREALETRRG